MTFPLLCETVLARQGLNTALKRVFILLYLRTVPSRDRITAPSCHFLRLALDVKRFKRSLKQLMMVRV
jgi:hypothetical protein